MSALAIIALSLTYSIVALVVARLLAGHMAWRFARIDAKGRYLYGGEKLDYEPDGDQWFGAWLMGLVVGFAWPVSIVVGLFLRVVPVRIGDEAKVLQGREKVALESRIKELERLL